MLVAIGLLLALAAWVFLFTLPRDGLWPRTWITATVLSGFSLVALAVTDRTGDVIGPINPKEVAAGLGVGAAWLIATHIGHAVCCRLFPTFLAQVNDLYAIRTRSSMPTMIGGVVMMGIAEELMFRGFLQDRLGLVAAIGVYTAVQVVERKWALMLAALLGGTVWGLLFWWRDGIVAPLVAHILWTGALTFVWPLKGCDGADPIEKAEAEARSADPQSSEEAPATAARAAQAEELS